MIPWGIQKVWNSGNSAGNRMELELNLITLWDCGSKNPGVPEGVLPFGPGEIHEKIWETAIQEVFPVSLQFNSLFIFSLFATSIRSSVPI